MSESSTPAYSRPGIYSRFFARFYDRFVAEYDTYIEPRKRELFSEIGGTVVEIGAGTGANLKFLPKDCRWIGVEPNTYMHPQILDKARIQGVSAEIRAASAEGLDVPDSLADIVVSTLVLCSVQDVDRVMNEVCRILKPGGRFVFIEHVVAPSGTSKRWIQQLVFPVWYLCGDGCRVNRDIAGSIRRAGFSALELDNFDLPSPPGLPWVSPHIIGNATL